MTEFLSILSACVVRKTARNSHIVWQIMTADGREVPGPPENYNGTAISGRMGWTTRRAAVAALAEWRRIVVDRSAR